MIDPQQALERLKKGNQQYVSGDRAHIRIDASKRSDVLLEQKPFAIILGCSDSRVPAEIIFSQGIGDLFVIRVAGNIVAPSQIGSIEFAAEQFGTRLVVVLGHSLCGAVTATLDQMRQPTENQSPNLQSIVSRIRPGLEDLVNTTGDARDEELLASAVTANVAASVRHLSHGSEIIEDLVARQQLLIVGAEYSLETGEVKFFDT